MQEYVWYVCLYDVVNILSKSVSVFVIWCIQTFSWCEKKNYMKSHCLITYSVYTQYDVDPVGN